MKVWGDKLSILVQSIKRNVSQVGLILVGGHYATLGGYDENVYEGRHAFTASKTLH